MFSSPAPILAPLYKDSTNFLEALRVLRPTGRVFIGLAIMEKLQRTAQPLSVRVKEKLKQGLASAFKAAAGKLALMGNANGGLEANAVIRPVMG